MRDKSGKKNLLLAATIVGLGLSASMSMAYASPENDLWDAINTEASSRTFTLNGDYTLSKDSLGDLEVENFTLEGNNYTVNLNNKEGLDIDDDDSTMIIRNTIMKKAKSTAEGAAIYNEGTLKIYGSQFNNNFADDDDGGAIWNDGTITEIRSSGFFYNRATDRGGAIFNDEKIGTITANFKGNEAWGNWGASYGGAIYNNGTIDSIKNSNFSNNWTDDHGGAIFNNDTITSITGTFEKNHAHYDGKQGGAIYNDEKIGSISADFKNNYAHKQGGAIYNNDKIDSIAGDFENNYAMTREGGAIYNDGTISTISANFKNNYTTNTEKDVHAEGGAIYNNKIIESITGTFDSNHIGKVKYHSGGGAIYNNGSIDSISATFSNNTSSAWGGAIYNDFSIKSISGTFERNNTQLENGGAIHNGYYIESITADFKYNSASCGGAISNSSRERTDVLHSFEAWFPNTPIIGSINSNFIGNTASYGGAIYIHPNLILDFFSGIPEISGKFTNNAAGAGGAFYTESNTSTKITADFEGNSAWGGNGGAIYYDGGVAGGTLTITGNFINNYAGKTEHHLGKGGAIYVDNNNLHIETDDTNDITFSGNKQAVISLARDLDMNITEVVGGESNAIYNNDYVEFNAKEGRTIWMYDGLEDSGDNAGWEWEKTGKGTLALGEDMKGVTGDVLVSEGTIKLVQNKNNQDIYGTAFYKANDVTYGKDVYIDSQNDHIGDFHLGGNDGGTVKLEGTLHSLMDVNLAEQTADKIIAGGNIEGSGNIVIEAIDIVTGGGSYLSERNVTIADDYTKGKISLGSNINITGEGYKGWALSYATDTGILNFKRGLTLKEVANATDPEARVFSAAGNEVITADIGNIGHGNANLIVNMNDYAINGKNLDDTRYSGFVTKAGDQELSINDAKVGNFLNTAGNGSFIYDEYGAEININNSTFMDNEAVNGGVIYSMGKLNLTDSSFYFNKATGLGGAIYSKGDVTVNAVNKEVGFADNIYGSGEFANAIYMEGTEESPITLALNSKNSTNEISIDDEINGSYYNILINDDEGSLGDIVFYNKVNTGSLTLSKGLLENNGIVTVTSGTNNGSISCDNDLSDVKGDFILDDGGSATPLVFNNNGNFTQNSLTIKSGEFKTDTNNLHITNDIVNDGTLVFNNANSGSIGQNIKGSTTSSNGVVEIATQDGATISLNGKSITNNDVKLTSGILDVTKNADSDGNINISSIGLISGDGTLNLQDNKAGNINLGNIKTADAKDLNVAIDVHFVTKPDDIDYAADIISVNSLTGDGKIHVNDIKMSKDDKPDPVEPTSTSMAVQVATGDIAIENMDFTGTTITNINKTFSSILLTYDNDKTSGTGGWLTIENTPATLAKAITSFVNVKLYAMSGDETIDNLYLYGDQLAVTTNGANILSTSGDNSKDGIHIADSLETLSFYGTLDSSSKPESKISGFKTAIDNSAGGEVHLENIEMSENTTDVLNAGNLNLDGKNIIDTVADDTTEPMGSTNIVGGTSTIGSITQKAVNILPGSELNICADKLSATDGVDNWGTLNLGSGDLASNVFESQTDPKQSVTNIVGDVTNTSGKTIAQKSVTIANTASLTTAADKVTADDGITNSGNLNLTGGEIASSVSGTGTTNIKGDVTNLSRNIIAQKSITIDNAASLTTNANILIAEDGISNAGDLNLIAGELGSDITGSGATNILDFIETNGKNITQTTVNVGMYQTEEIEGKLINDAVITATDINVSSYGILTSAANSLIASGANGIANAGELNLTGGNLASIVTGAGTTNIKGDVGFADTTTTISQDVHITETWKLTAATTNLTGNSVTNDSTLTFNNTEDGLIAQNIAGSDTDSSGIVEIAASDGIKIGLNGKTITNNDVKLTSGIFDVTSIADTNHNIDVSSVGNSIIANDGTLSVQDGETGNITLGTVATGTGDNTKNLNVAIDTNFATNTTETDSGITGHADVISVASLTGDGKIHISDIRMTADPIATEMTAQVATGDTAIENLDFTGTTISNMSDSAGSLLLSYDNDTTSATKGYLTAVHSDLTNAITSSITTKMYSMGGSEPAIDNLTLGGTSLSITTNGHDIVSTSNSADGIKIANSGQTLSITGTLDSSSGNPETTISGFKTAIDNSKGGTVNLTNIELNGNTTDIQNEGTLNLNGKNAIGTIADNTTPTGTTTVKSGTSAIGSLVQKTVKILSGGTVNIDADKLTTTEGTDNQSTLNLGGGNLASNINDSQATKTGTTNIVENVTNTLGKTISQKLINVDEGVSLTTAADKVIATDEIFNKGSLILTGGTLTSTVKGADGQTYIENGNVIANATIYQKINIEAGKGGTLTASADNVRGRVINDVENGLVLTGGTTYLSPGKILGSGSTKIDAGTDGTVFNLNSIEQNVNIASGTLQNYKYIEEIFAPGYIKGNITIGTEGTLKSPLHSDYIYYNSLITNNGKIYIEDDYLRNIAGASGTTYLEQDVITRGRDCTIAGTLDAQNHTVNMVDYAHNTLSVGNIKNAKLGINIDAANNLFDSIQVTGATSTGAVNLTNVDIKNYNNVIGKNPYSITSQIINNTNGGDISLDLTGLEDKTLTTSATYTYDTNVTKDMKWSDVIGEYTVTDATVNAAFGLDTTSVTNDSLTVTLTTTGGTETLTTQRDTLAALIAATGTGFENKTFTADSDATYVVGQNEAIDGLGTLAGNLIIDGGTEYAKIDGNSKSGITVNSGSTLTVKDADLDNFSGAAITNSGTLNIENIIFGSDIGLAIVNKEGGILNSDSAAYQSRVENRGTSLFVGDEFLNNRGGINGGAIYNTGSLTLTGTDFFFNKAEGLGGAIYSTKDVTINAENVALEFTGNVDSSGANDIYMAGTAETPITLALNSKTSDHVMIINDGINGTYYNTVINGAEGSTGRVLFHGDVNTDALTVSAGTLVNNGDLTVKSGTNNGTIRGAGNFILNDGGASTPLIFNNNDSFIQRSLTIKSGKFITDTNNLYLISENDIDDDDFEIVDDIVNDGTLTFNNTANGIIAKNIKGSTASSNGIVEIAISSGKAISLNGKSITNNDVKLTSGIFDVTSNADDDGNINISSMGLISGNGILNVQDGKTGTITLGDVDTVTNAKDLNITIDVDLVGDNTKGSADYLTQTGTFSGSKTINIKDIALKYDAGTITPDNIMIADSTISSSNLSLVQTAISGTNIGNLLLTLTNNSTGTYLHTEHSDLENAITSSISTKLYAMGENENFDDLILGGTSLSITTNGYDITSTSNDKSEAGIKVANSNQELSIIGKLDASGNPETTISGFDTAIDNSKGGTVNLTNIELNGNTTDIQNEGTLNLNGKNAIGTIADNTTPTGTTNVKSGTSIIDTITQKIVEIFTGAKLETKTVTASEQVKNAGDLTITGTSNSSKITGNGTTEFTNNVNNSGDISQGTVKVADGKTLTTTGDITTDNLTNGGTVTLNSADTTLTIKGGTSDTPTTVGGTINGTGSTKIEGNAQNNGTIASAVEIAASGKLSTNANDVTGVITNNATGGLTLTGGTIQNTIDGTGSTVISGTVLNNKDTIGKSIDNAVTIASTGNLTTAADKLGGAVENNGTTNGLTLTGGQLSQNVTGTGKTVIAGTDVSVKYGNSIAQDIEITSGNKLINTNVTAIGGDVENNGDIQLYSQDNGKLEHNITGTGTTELNQKVVVAADIENAINIKSYTDSESVVHNANVTVESGHKFGITGKDITVDLNNNLIMQDADDIKGNLINNGAVELQGGLISSTITGTGTTNISGNVGTNGNNITQTNVIIGYNGTDETNGLLINDTVINATNINVTELGFLGNIGTISAAAIANAGNVYIENGNVNVGNLITVTNGTTNVYGGNVNADSIINNGETNISYGVVVADIIENTGAGTTTISGGNVTANTSIINSGTGSTDISSVVKTPLVSASDGTININATGGQTATSNLLKDKAGTGAANITTLAGSTVAVNTNSNTMAIDNNVSGAGTLKLNGSTGSEFYVSPNVVVASAVNIAAGQLNADDGLNITGPISVAPNATLSTMNGNYTTFNNITFANGANLKVDVNAVSNKSDKFATPIEPTGGYEYLTDLNIQDINKISQNSKSINLSNAIGLNNLQSSDSLTANLADKYSSVLTPIRKMNANVQMTPQGLMLNIAGTGNKYKDFNPAVMASPVAAQMGGYLTQLQSYDEAFRNMDMYMLMTAGQRQALKYKNKIASLDGGVLYDKTLLRQERAEGWFRPYVTFEKVGLKNGPKVENQAYGTFVGGESKMYDLGHGWDGMWGAYVGYNGSHQNYDGVSIYQNGGTLGLTGMAYKGNFFTGLTLNSGASAGEASTMYGNDNFAMLMAGIASKTGYNWELGGKCKGKFIIQPSFMMSYSFVNTFDYTNAAGVRMHSSPLNAIQLQPELKFIGNLKNGWQPYASVAMVWNIMDDTKFKANDVTLPELSVKPYVKYGVGVSKTWGERFTGFFQTYLTNGGRNGVGLQAGFTWALGGGKDKKADEQKIQKSLKKTPVLKKTEITLNDSNA